MLEYLVCDGYTLYIKTDVFVRPRKQVKAVKVYCDLNDPVNSYASTARLPNALRRTRFWTRAAFTHCGMKLRLVEGRQH
ncbi:hypothetical protein POSPLADRAFT_1066219 [Postia placenta MAD-698-R-SB12]|uniref:Uncharacterized protein n=1 Tax=Postia placenta MAD-698-R-SB12 TaxID=670580 RepID=A0A1X6MZG7_9APHY|nr:hypothetical protein POSPLADRAFT_1066219 [Postia placenta MAD-698-R-SB12]OSX61583.1 hypothetical protein POSPLADRAFT_1066219 [Postia placenta MAD-698-R-SB12]